jgi:hypothetical protein
MSIRGHYIIIPRIWSKFGHDILEYINVFKIIISRIVINSKILMKNGKRYPLQTQPREIVEKALNQKIIIKKYGTLYQL